MALNLSKNKINKLISLLNSSDESSDLEDAEAEKINEVIKVVSLEHKPIELEDSSGSESEIDEDYKPIKSEEDASSNDDKNSIAEYDPNDPLNINNDDKLNLNSLYSKQEVVPTDSSTTVTQNDTMSKTGKRKYIKKSMLNLDYRDDEALHEIKKTAPARGGKFHCNFCKSRCLTQIQLNSHLKIHKSSDAGKYYCRTCDILFATSRNLRRHIQSHQVKPKRYLPNEQFVTELQYETSCMPNETKILECKICNLTFPKILILRKHLQGHTKAESIDIEIIKKNDYLTNLVPDGATNLCKVIDYIVTELQAGRMESFYTATNMVGNELNLSDSETDTDAEEELLQENIYACELCEKRFSRRYKILYHQRNDHTAAEIKIECDICKIKYVSKKLLEYHTKTQCGNIDKKFTCYICKMKYMWKDNMKRHIKLHHKSKELIQKYVPPKKEECKICKKKVTRLDRHLAVHELEKNFHCDKCLMKFKRKSNLRVHMKIHDENYNDPSEVNKSHLCGFCGRKFRKKSHLVYHTRVHTGEKPYKCEFCDRGFTSSSNLTVHRRSHTGEKHIPCKKKFTHSYKPKSTGKLEKTFQCEICLRPFKRKDNLKSHMKTHRDNKNEPSEDNNLYFLW